MRTAVGGSVVAATAAGLAAFQVGPAATWLPGLRPRWLRGLGSADSIALTFDDGPDPQGTPAVLDALSAIGWPATFFLLGCQVRRYPGLAREIVARGHELGLHGDDHRYLIARGPRAVVADLERGRAAVEAAAGTAVRWWRPPYGVLSGPSLVAAKRRGLRSVIWSSWGRDWRADATPPSIVHNVTATGLRGATVLLHDSDALSAPDSWRATAAAVPLIAGQAERLGVRPQRLSDHLGDPAREAGLQLDG